MFDTTRLDDLASKLADALPQGFRDLRADAQKNVRAALASALAKMDLVTREEFDVQRAVLARTREKVEQLEQRVTELEAKLKK